MPAQVFDWRNVFSIRQCKGLGRMDVVLWNCIRLDVAAEEGTFDRLWPWIMDSARFDRDQFLYNPLAGLFGIKLKGLYCAVSRSKANLLIYEDTKSEGSECLQRYLQVGGHGERTQVPSSQDVHASDLFVGHSRRSGQHMLDSELVDVVSFVMSAR